MEFWDKIVYRMSLWTYHFYIFPYFPYFIQHFSYFDYETDVRCKLNRLKKEHDRLVIHDTMNGWIYVFENLSKQSYFLLKERFVEFWSKRFNILSRTTDCQIKASYTSCVKGDYGSKC